MLLLRLCRWPAQVLDERDPWIPSDAEPPRRGAIPVRFFGTYDFAWIESQRAICPFEQGYEEHSTKSKQKVCPGTSSGLEAEQRVRQSQAHHTLFWAAGVPGRSDRGASLQGHTGITRRV